MQLNTNHRNNKLSLLALLFIFMTTDIYAQDRVDSLQQDALDLLKKLPGGTHENAQKQVKEVFDYYDGVTANSAMPGSEKVNSKVVQKTANRAVTSSQNKVNQRQTKAMPISMPLGGSSNYKALPADAYPEDRDPFALTSRLIKQNPSDSRKQNVQSEKRAYSFTRLNTGIDVPKLSLRGLIRKSAKDKAAILEVEGLGTYVVREGDTITIPSGGFNNVIKVTQIERLSLLIEVGKLGEVIVVR